jgi:hypothetical protein
MAFPGTYIPGGGGKKGPIDVEKDRPDPPEGTFGAGIYPGFQNRTKLRGLRGY